MRLLSEGLRIGNLRNPPLIGGDGIYISAAINQKSGLDQTRISDHHLIKSEALKNIGSGTLATTIVNPGTRYEIALSKLIYL